MPDGCFSKNKSIIIVEQNADVAQSLKYALKREFSIQAVICENIVEALEAELTQIGTAKEVVLLIDAYLESIPCRWGSHYGGMNLLCEYIRIKWKSRLPVVIMTSCQKDKFVENPYHRIMKRRTWEHALYLIHSPISKFRTQIHTVKPIDSDRALQKIIKQHCGLLNIVISNLTDSHYGIIQRLKNIKVRLGQENIQDAQGEYEKMQREITELKQVIPQAHQLEYFPSRVDEQNLKLRELLFRQTFNGVVHVRSNQCLDALERHFRRLESRSRQLFGN